MLAPPEREWKGWPPWLRLVAPQRLQRKHNLAGLPPEQMFVTAEAVKGECRQSGQTQEAVRDILFRIETELNPRRRVRLPCCYQV